MAAPLLPGPEDGMMAYGQRSHSVETPDLFSTAIGPRAFFGAKSAPIHRAAPRRR
jgi:hypothetical protein